MLELLRSVNVPLLFEPRANSTEKLINVFVSVPFVIISSSHGKTEAITYRKAVYVYFLKGARLNQVIRECQ